MAEQSHWHTYLVEHYWPGVTEAEFRDSARRVAASADRMAHAGLPVRFLHSTLVPEDEAAFCVLTAASPDAVEQAYAAAGVGYERLVEAIDVDAGGDRTPVPIGPDPGPTTGHSEQPRSDLTEEEPSWTSATLPADP